MKRCVIFAVMARNGDGGGGDSNNDNNNNSNSNNKSVAENVCFIANKNKLRLSQANFIVFEQNREWNGLNELH